MESFSNQTINFNKLPDYKKTELTPIAKRYKKVLLFNLIVSNVIIFGIAVAVSILFLDEVIWLYKGIALMILFLIIMISNVFSLIAFKRKSFAFREQDVIYCSGVLSISYEIVPYNRLQHVVLKQGWLSRFLGLATIECYTAASSNNEVAIPGLELEQAEKIKNLLLNKINQVELKETSDNEDASNDDVNSNSISTDQNLEENATN